MYYTLCYPTRKIGKNTEILLGFMASGLWKDHFNGFGGKIENETPTECVIRELKEEIDIDVSAKNLLHCGTVLFLFDEIDSDGNKYQDLVEIFTYEMDNSFLPASTDEIIPSWFSIDKLPLHKMPPFDKWWIKMLRYPTFFHKYIINIENGDVANVRGQQIKRS